MEKGMQKIVYQVVKTLVKNYRKYYVTRAEIIEEVKKIKNEEHKDIVRKVEQALYHLKQKNMLKNIGYGRWTLPRVRQRYQPKICKALIYLKDRQQWYCPIKKTYIGNPFDMCELIHGFTFDENGDIIKAVYPMQPCYFDKKPTQMEIETIKLLKN